MTAHATDFSGVTMKNQELAFHYDPQENLSATRSSGPTFHEGLAGEAGFSTAQTWSPFYNFDLSKPDSTRCVIIVFPITQI